ncbi:hypothetical protein AMTR_s00181p00024070 [Amborella trichopoda]|uniref:Uncharacterized protein n=1 Tax=Amborella trichopoda TaxID=13333 RepID=W1P528_AMBTC|nr:hypothetical protein AMTR_s00181p00024070 [Amborella trichopoda]
MSSEVDPNGLIGGEVEEPDNEGNPLEFFRVLDSVNKCLASANEDLELEMRGGVAVSTGVFVVALVVVSNVFAAEVSNGFIDDKHFLLAHKHGPLGP